MSPNGEERAAKRRKVPSASFANGENVESTTELGLTFLVQLKQARDKRGRLIATSFLTLPDKKQLPEYYEAITLPLAIDVVEAKLNNREYPTLTTVESDMKRMVNNAKSFNEKSSEVYADAERIRKMLSNWMPKHNPAYQNPKYVAFPTPLPEEAEKADTDPDADAEGDIEVEEEIVEKPRRPINAGRQALAKPVNGRATSTPAVEDAQGAGEAFDGNSFQQAQEKLVTEMMNLKNDDDQATSQPFLSLPSRQLSDYYSLIKKPVCLRGIQKRVLGIHGRKEATGISDYRGWDAFAEEVRLIWRNAWEYNEDGSDISTLAGELEVFFEQRLAEATKVVSEPPHPNGESAGTQRIKLKMSSAKSPGPSQPKIMLRVGGGRKASPATAPTSRALGQMRNPSTGSAAVNKEGSRHQEGHVQDETNGGSVTRPGPKNPFGGSQSGSGTSAIPTLGSLGQEKHRSASAASPTLSAAVKTEAHAGQSPALTAVRTSSTGPESQRDSQGFLQPTTQSPNLAASAMPPPSSTIPRLPSGSPRPTQTLVQNHVSHVQPHAPISGFDTKWRQAGKDASDALISNLSISTHPELKVPRHFHLDVLPSATMSQQSITFSLPAASYYLQIVPTIAAVVNNRQHKLFVTAGAQRIHPVPQRPDQSDPKKPLFEARLSQGINRIEIEIIAGSGRGAPKTGTGPDVEFEKITLFANLLRA
ncbi:MAG: hypothetical protein M1827_005512 [Pycnora praestabilis]|nr:MAG: hypothetical protein M1827_005512 [Pycnora praestabilis]